MRDAEWLVRRVDRTSTGDDAYTVVGISEIVRDKEAVFLRKIERPEVLDPASTAIVIDRSAGYSSSLLAIESLLRQTPPTDDNLYIGHLGAMDPVLYQRDPAIQALDQTRQRILIADAVGLGKTMECGVLLTELIRRGRGKRILVLAIKSMLTQFQKELWSRFTIPLTRLDSVGLRGIRHNIPTNHNPFYYYDRAIISIDTLKRDAEYRTYLENAYWDVIVVDEAQNVAERGTSLSLRSKLANLLAERSDTLVMLSATPHDGKARSFASLMNMLDPTAIADPDRYGPDDIEGLFIRRFKKDIKDQVSGAFKQRRIKVARCEASEAEERAFDALASLSFTKIDQRRSGGLLFKTTLEKALLSSTAACLQTVENRVEKLKKTADPAFTDDIATLKRLADRARAIKTEDFSKYQKLLWVIRDQEKGLGWTGRDPGDRLVIFTERLKTMEFLAQSLQRDLKLKKNQVETLDGGMPDTKQNQIVEAFGQDSSPIRLLVATDVASEGINLHYLSHKMIHFDIPWSLMVFKQRNGRIDRYGQEHAPQIVYLVTDSTNEKIKGDTRILDILIDKDQQAHDNIGDPSVWMGVYDIDTEELITGQAIERGESAEDFDAELEASAFDPLAALMAGSPPTGERAEAKTRSLPSLFRDDYAYLKAALEQIGRREDLQVELDDDARRIELTAPADLRHRFKFLPPETMPDDKVFRLSGDADAVQAEVRRCRKDERAWPQVHYLWPLHPVVEWANDKVLAAFGRHEAPLITLPKGTLAPGEVVYLLSGLIPNRKSHPLLHLWFGVVTRDGAFERIETLEELLERTELGRREFPNRLDSEDEAVAYQSALPEVIDHARAWMSQRQREFEEAINDKLDGQLAALEKLRDRHKAQLEERYEGSKLPESVIQERREAELRRINKLFDEFIDWVQDTMTTEDNPYVQVIAVLRGGAT